MYQIEAQINCIHDPGTILKNQLKILLYSHKKTVDTTLHIKGGYILSAQSSAVLQRLRLQVIAVHGSNISSMPDVGSQNATLINPYSNENSETLMGPKMREVTLTIYQKQLPMLFCFRRCQKQLNMKEMTTKYVYLPPQNI